MKFSGEAEKMGKILELHQRLQGTGISVRAKKGKQQDIGCEGVN